ncbi:MAG: hypothetical protein RLZZ618_2380 [Pseudomonadota bacterium]|jgi:hypothetical protein
MNIFHLTLGGLTLAAAAATAARPPAPAQPLLIPVCVRGDCGVVDGTGRILVPFSGTNSLHPGDYTSFYVYGKAGRYGIKTRAGQVLVKPLYDDIAPQFGGFCAVQADGRWGFVNERGALIIPAAYDDYFPHEQAGVFVMRQGERELVFDRTGRRITDLEPAESVSTFEKPQEVEAGLHKWLKVEPPGHIGAFLFNTETGAKTPLYPKIYYSQNGHILVENHEGLHTLVNAQGKEIFPFQRLQYLGLPSHGWIPFGERNLMGYLDMNGQVAIPARYSHVGHVGRAGAVASPEGSDLRGVIDRRGEWVLEPAFTVMTTSFSVEGTVVPLYRNGRTGVFDLDTLQWVIPLQHEFATTVGRFVSAGSAPPWQVPDRTGDGPKAMGLFDQHGKLLLKPKYRMFDVMSRFAFGAAGYLKASNTVGANAALVNPEGRDIIGLDWPDYAFEAAGVFIGGKRSPSNALVPSAYYDTTGKLLLRIQRDACGRQQLVTGEQRPVWPRRTAGRCPR